MKPNALRWHFDRPSLHLRPHGALGEATGHFNRDRVCRDLAVFPGCQQLSKACRIKRLSPPLVGVLYRNNINGAWGRWPQVCAGCHSIAFAHSQDQAEDRHALVRFLGGEIEMRQVVGDGLLGLGQGVSLVQAEYAQWLAKKHSETAAPGTAEK